MLRIDRVLNGIIDLIRAVQHRSGLAALAAEVHGCQIAAVGTYPSVADGTGLAALSAEVETALLAAAACPETFDCRLIYHLFALGQVDDAEVTLG